VTTEFLEIKVCYYRKHSSGSIVPKRHSMHILPKLDIVVRRQGEFSFEINSNKKPVGLKIPTLCQRNETRYNIIKGIFMLFGCAPQMRI